MATLVTFSASIFLTWLYLLLLLSSLYCRPWNYAAIREWSTPLFYRSRMHILCRSTLTFQPYIFVNRLLGYMSWTLMAQKHWTNLEESFKPMITLTSCPMQEYLPALYSPIAEATSRNYLGQRRVGWIQWGLKVSKKNTNSQLYSTFCNYLTIYPSPSSENRSWSTRLLPQVFCGWKLDRWPLPALRRPPQASLLEEGRLI